VTNGHQSRVTNPSLLNPRMDQTPSALFDSYEQDFRHIISGISDSLEGSGRSLIGGSVLRVQCPILHLILQCLLEQRKATLRRVEIELDEADDIVCFLLCMWR
jgi:vesicle transport through interaction with t-SNAREs protein 1